MTTENISGPNKSTAKLKASKRATGKTISKGNTKVANKPPAKADAKAPAKMGRPSLYSDEVAHKICEHLIQGKPLTPERTRKSGLPNPSTIFRWIEEREDFRERYVRAREFQAYVYADQTIDIADTEEDAAKARNRIEIRKWHAAKMAPKTYGDLQRVEVTADIGATAAAVLMDLTAKARAKQLDHQTIDITPRRFADTLPTEQEQ
jgi:hypothetical protein